MIDLRPHNDPARLMDEAKDWAATCSQLRDQFDKEDFFWVCRLLNTQTDRFLSYLIEYSQGVRAVSGFIHGKFARTPASLASSSLRSATVRSALGGKFCTINQARRKN